mmetsp:Transcript_8490/g.19492  ORF Transcript_8490/g.19492 Transcript_8490/m.19492 type:complete len:104 (-) Transcript_8490:41-352(-)
MGQCTSGVCVGSNVCGEGAEDADGCAKAMEIVTLSALSDSRIDRWAPPGAVGVAAALVGSMLSQCTEVEPQVERLVPDGIVADLPDGGGIFSGRSVGADRLDT